MEFQVAIPDPVTSSLLWALAALGVYAVGFLLLSILGGHLQSRGGLLGTAFAGAAFACAVLAWIGFEEDGRLAWDWLELGGRNLELSLRLDLQAARMWAMVTGITFLVHLFSTSYMAHEGNVGRYWSFLSLFAFAMGVLVLAADLLLMFMAWELVGLASWFLIGFWFRKPEAAQASQKAFVMNRIGDAGFVLALMCLFAGRGSFALEGLEANAMTGWMGLVAGFGLMAAAFGKSAQFPFQTWLPDAMAGPTPVSSLIHAATMVAAGVYLLFRCAPFFLPLHLHVLTGVGAGTALAAAISALSQTDIKRVLAYSTISQLGLMVMGIGVGALEFTFLHLLTHAFFKCGLFLGAGAVIHLLHETAHRSGTTFDAQDMRWMGGLGRKSPLLALCYVVFAASLAGLPFFSGFISKDGLLDAAWVWGQSHGGIAWIVPFAGILTSTLTAFYIARQAILIFGGKNRLSLQAGKESILEKFPRLPLSMGIPLLILAAFSFWILWSFGNPFHVGSHLFPNFALHGNPPVWLHWLLTSLGLSAIASAWLIYRKGPAISNPNKWVFQLSVQHFFWDRVLHAGIAQAALVFSRALGWFDRRVVDGLVNLVADLVVRKEGKPSLSSAAAWNDRNIVDRAVNAAAEATVGIGARIRAMQGGHLQQYLIYTLLAILILILGFYYLTTS